MFPPGAGMAGGMGDGAIPPGMEDMEPSPEQMLAFLEALQKSGQPVPKDLEELMNNVKRGRGQPTDDVPTEEITPEAGFVIKTQDLGSGAKVFINMCGHPKVAAPGNWANGRMPEEVSQALENMDNLDTQQAETLRFPLSMGEPQPDLDRKGERCTTLDIVFNADVIKQAQSFRQLKAFLIELALGWVGHKHKMELDPKFKLPKMKYKGEDVRVQRIRVDRKALVTEISEVPEEPQFPLVTKKIDPAKLQPATASTSAAAAAGGSSASGPAAAAGAKGSGQGGAVAVAGAASGSGSGSQFNFAGKDPDLKHTVEYVGRPVERVDVCVELPPGTSSSSSSSSSSGVAVEVCGREVYVRAPGARSLQLSLPFAVSAQGASCRVEAAAASGTSSAGTRLRLQLPYLSLPDYVAAMRAEAPLSFGQLQLASERCLELEP